MDNSGQDTIRPTRHKPSLVLETSGGNFLIWLLTSIGLWLSRLLALFFARYKRSRTIKITHTDIEPESVYVIASNHQSIIDPFMICQGFPGGVWNRFGTFRYFTANSLFRSWLLRHVIMVLGCFPARSHPSLPYGLSYAVEQVEYGRTILIFPEGRRTIRAESPVRHGVEVLARIPHLKIIPAHIEWTRHSYWRRTFKLGIGKPFDASQMTAEQIMDRVYDQPVE